MRHLAMTPAKTACSILHRGKGRDNPIFVKIVMSAAFAAGRTLCLMAQRARRIIVPLAIFGHIFTEKDQPSEGPVDHPRTTGIEPSKAAGVVFQGIIEVLNMLVSPETRHTKSIQGISESAVRAFQEGQTEFHGLILHLACFRAQRVADGGELREQRGNLDGFGACGHCLALLRERRFRGS